MINGGRPFCFAFIIYHLSFSIWPPFMDERVVQFRVGVTVLAALIITGILMLLFGELPSVLRGSYTLYVKFPSAPGVAQDTPVRSLGIHIGRVTNVQFTPDSE